MNKIEEELAEILSNAKRRNPNPVETLMGRPAVGGDSSSNADEKDKLLKLLLRQLREALMDIATDENTLAQEAGMLALPVPEEGFHNKATELVLHLITLLKKMGASEDVRQILEKYKKDPFFK